tara:strand:- start:577 stop:723 length:147 start_codon:yes stop_codon:yes gene_type:complete
MTDKKGDNRKTEIDKNVKDFEKLFKDSEFDIRSRRIKEGIKRSKKDKS